MATRKPLIEALLAAYDAGVISLIKLCPNCDKNMGPFNHGVCQHCKKNCGCSFNPVSSSDHCNMHGALGPYKRIK